MAESHVLKGIYQFEKESISEYKDWATDAPAENFEWVLDECKKGQRDPKDIVEINEFIEKNFADW